VRHLEKCQLFALSSLPSKNGGPQLPLDSLAQAYDVPFRIKCLCSVSCHLILVVPVPSLGEGRVDINVTHSKVPLYTGVNVAMSNTQCSPCSNVLLLQIVFCFGIVSLEKSAIKFFLAYLPLLLAVLSPFFFLEPIALGRSSSE